MGIVFADLQTGSILYQLNGEKSYTPASLMKLITAYGALKIIPRGKVFETRLMSAAQVHKGELQGDLYLVGEGDPTFVSESMWALVNNFKRSGISKVKGNIIVDDSFFDGKGEEKRIPSSRAYDAPMSAMSFNWNTVNVYVRPSQVAHSPLVFADPQNDFIKVVNKARTVSGKGSGIVVERFEFHSREGYKNEIRVTGSIGVNESEKVIYRGVTRPSLWSGYNLKSFLAREGIRVSGFVRKGVTQSEARELAHWESEPLTFSITKMMKFSNNYIAKMLLRHIGIISGATFVEVPSTSKQSHRTMGLMALRSMLSDLGLKNVNMVDGSGLSHQNKVSALEINKLLSLIFSDFLIFPEFASSLPIGGIDGTLQKRFPSEVAELRAKTGLLTGVIGLAGYIGPKKGSLFNETKSFVFIYNGSSKEMTKAKDLADKMIFKILDRSI